MRLKMDNASKAAEQRKLWPGPVVIDCDADNEDIELASNAMADNMVSPDS
ncbi:MAG: hypothetical protein HKN78_02560 [Sphingomonadaceae bacterium]|nr:hypothetical protein [Sphingomonadaceae bacterium]